MVDGGEERSRRCPAAKLVMCPREPQPGVWSAHMLLHSLRTGSCSLLLRGLESFLSASCSTSHIISHYFSYSFSTSRFTMCSVDDDAEPLPWVVQTMVTWAGIFPDAALGECGWNTTCLTGRVPHVCGEGNDVYLFVRRVSRVCCLS